MTTKKIKMTQCSVPKSNGKYHRKCLVVIPKKFSDAYPDDQVFEVHRDGNKLVYTPIKEVVPAWKYDDAHP